VNVQGGWRKPTAIAMAAGFLLLGAASAFAGGDSVVVTIQGGDRARADITLHDPNTGIEYTAEFELEFEEGNVDNLTPECLGLTADWLDAGEIHDIEQRMIHVPQQVIDPNFPIRVTVEPPAACGLAFNNQYDVTFETDDLVYAPESKYRLMKAPVGGPFKYVTGSVTQGSVRSRGSSGGFSEFVIIRDDGQGFAEYGADCVNEYAALRARLDQSTMSLSARRTLETDLDLSEAAYDAGNYAEAIALLANFEGHCVDFGGEGLPNRWRSTRDLDNVEGDLIGHASTLRFLMGRLDGSP
jgi:hypothetical protein